MPVIGERYIKGEFPKQLIPGMAELGCSARTCRRSTAARAQQVAYGLIMQDARARRTSGIPRSRIRVRAAW